MSLTNAEVVQELNRRHARPYLLDTICMTVDEYEEIISNNGGEIPVNEDELIDKPALKEFAIYDREYKSYLIFREPADKSTRYRSGDDGNDLVKPIIEMSTLLEGTEEPQNIYIFCRSINNDNCGIIVIKSFRNDIDQTYLPNKLISFYLVVQSLLYNRPEIFEKTTERRVFEMSESGNGRQRKDRKRVVKMVRVIRINKDEVEKIKKAHRVITCPCWGVVGHFREYKKTGKRVWIQPYRKGKQRNDPAAYSPKEYRI